MIDVRRIRPGDAHALRAARLAALEDEPSAFAMTLAEEAALPLGQWTEWAHRRARSDSEATFLAFANGQEPVGLVGTYLRSPSTAELVSMWVAPEARRRSVGAELVEAVISWAAEVGCSAIELWVTRGNEPAERFYERAGFVVTGDVQPLPSDPCRNEIRMRLDLTMD